MVAYKSKGFMDLQVWQLAKDLAVRIYKITENFPSKEQFGLTSQIRRCSVSIASNIAEGAAWQTKLDFSRFITISMGSIAELKTQLIISKEVGFLKEDDYIGFEQKLDQVAKMLKSLKNSLKD